MKVDINGLYNVIENCAHHIIGMRPYVTDKDLGFDSLDFVEISLAVDSFVGFQTPSTWYRQIPNDSSVLEITAYLHKKIEEE